MGRTNRASRTGCATRLNYKKVKYLQSLLRKVHYETPLPFGQDRLIPIWVATLALKQKSRIVRFQNAAEMLAFFRLQPDGFHYRRIEDGFKRIFASTIFFGTEDYPAGHKLIDWALFHFFDQMKLWFSTQEHSGGIEAEDQGNVITL